MDSLLALPIGDFRTVELTLRLTMALVAVMAVLLGFSTTCVPPQFRFPLILSSTALLGAAWFESGVWVAWKEAFELAGASYCVTGQLLAAEDRIMAWSIGVPALLGSFALLGRPRGERGTLILLVLLALLAPASSIMALLVLGILGWRFWKPGNPCARHLRVAHAWVVGLLLLTLLGSWHCLPLGKVAGRILIRGEVVRSFCDILSFVIPALLLLTGVLRIGAAGSQPVSESLPLKEKKTKPRAADSEDPQSGLFGD